MKHICVPINSELIGEMFLRKGPAQDVSDWVENILQDYLDRTQEDEGWNDEYYDYVGSKKWSRTELEEFGDPKNGYHWTSIFIPNGSEISMEYKREKHTAIVKHERIYYLGETFTPAEFARKVANNTSRNAWRDLYIKKPGEARWTLADQLRRKGL
jgi:hypothetical protein